MFLEATQEGGRALFERGIEGPFVMLNLVRFKAVADYGDYPDLAPPEDISGREAYQRYLEAAQTFLEAAGGSVLFVGEGGTYFVGPADEAWDLCLLVRHASVGAFVANARDPQFMAIHGHRMAALEDSRLLPLEE